MPYWHDDIGKSFLALMQDVDALLLGRRPIFPARRYVRVPRTSFEYSDVEYAVSDPSGHSRTTSISPYCTTNINAHSRAGV